MPDVARESPKSDQQVRTVELPLDTFRRQLQEARKRAGLSQAALAERIGELGGTLHQSAIARIEKGSREVFLGEAMLIAAALGVSPLHLLVPVDDDVMVHLAPDDPHEHAATAVRDWVRGQAPLNRGWGSPMAAFDAMDLFYAWTPELERQVRAHPAYNALANLAEALVFAIHEDLGVLPATDDEHSVRLGHVVTRLMPATQEISRYAYDSRMSRRAAAASTQDVAE